MTDLRVLWMMLALALAGALLYVLAPVLTPFLIAALLAYMFNPLVTHLEGWRVPRTLSVLLLFVLLGGLLTLLLLWLVPRAQLEISTFAGKLPGYLDTLQHTLLPWLQSLLGEQAGLFDFNILKQQFLDHWREVGSAAGEVLGTLSRSGMRVAGWLVNLVLVPVVAFYLLRDWNGIVARVYGLFPLLLQPQVARLARETDEVLGAFLRGQLLVMLMLAFIYSAGLWLIGLDLALTIGLVAGLVSFVPYLGFIVGLAAASVAAFFQFQDVWMLVWVLAVFGAGQALDGMLITPTLVGERIGLHPVAVIFAVLAGGQLFGFFGVLLALPAAAVMVVWLRHLHGGLLRSVAAKPAHKTRRR
ncbi:MAG TPA: AI-2E family transporter [Acidiferrobacterales bacterium]|nr:AI-2E family transporter [Acidiferrobacterales bacterium]